VLIFDENSESETNNNDEEEGNDEIDRTDVGNKEQNYTLLSLTDESASISTVIDVKSVQKFKHANNSPPSFPNLAYEAFVQLLVKHHLSDSVANDIIGLFNNFHMDPTATLPSNAKAARKLLDSMQIPHVLYKKSIVMEYDQIQYTLHYRTIFDAIKELLCNKEILNHCIFDYTPSYATNDKGEEEKCYGEQYNCEWWCRTQASINRGAKVLSIILYSDATTCDTLGKTSEHPVFLTLSNIPFWRRNKPDAKVLLAYLPKIKASDEQKRQHDFALAKHYLFHHSMEIIIEPIKSNLTRGFDLHTDNGIIWCYPFLSILLGDLPEQHAITLTYSSANCNMPYHACTTPKNEFNNPLIDHSEIQLRTPTMMQYVLQEGLAAEYSLQNIENPFWKLP